MPTYPDFCLPERDDKGNLPSFAWPGGYPLYYLDSDNNTLCPDCANKSDMSTEPRYCDVNYEDADLYCDDCSRRIESAYAEPDAEEGELP